MCACDPRDQCSRKMPTDTSQNAKKTENTFQPDCSDTFYMGVLGQAKHSKAASVHSGIILQHMNQGVLHQESAVTKDTQSIGRVHLGLSIMAEGPEPADRAGQSPTQFRGCQAEWINGQRVPSSDHAFQPQETSVGPGWIQGAGLQSLSSTLYGLSTKNLIEPSPEGETRGTEPV